MDMMLIDCPAPARLDPSLDDATLVERIKTLARQEREARADFIVCLAELDQRRLYAKAGYPSLFAWLTEHLHIPKASAYRRVTAARLFARMPAVASYLREGRLSLTKLCFLKDVLQPDNVLTLLEQAASMAEKDVEELAAVLGRPAITPPPRDSIRPILPPPPPPATGDLFATPPAPALVPPLPPTPALGSVAEPNTPIRHVIKMTVGPEFIALLDEVRAELSHAHAGASLEVLLSESMRRALQTWRKRSRGATERPRAQRADGRSRNIPAAVRRAVWKRDGGRCAFVGTDGHRCGARHRLQFHHVQPYARDGVATVENIRVFCAVHNDLAAREDFGDEAMDAVSSRGSHARRRRDPQPR